MRDLMNITETAFDISLEEANTLTLKSAKILLSHLESARGQIAEFLALNPWLVGLCQEAAREHLGGSFSVYRAVTVTDTLRAEAIASTTLDWRVAYRILDEAPSVVWHGSEMLKASQVLLHYRLSPEQVALWVPVALDFVRTAVAGKEKNRVQTRDGTMRIEAVLAAIDRLDEQEIIADLTGLRPDVLEFEGSVRGGEVRDLFRHFMAGSLPVPVTGEWLVRQHMRFVGVEDANAQVERFRAWRG